MAAPLLLPLRVYQSGMGLGVLLAVAGPLLLPLLVCQLGTGFYVLLAVAVLLLLPILVYQPSTGLCMLFAVAIPLLLSGYGGHVVSSRQHVLGGGVHSSHSANKRNIHY
jgi:hypothetical protein